MRNSLFILFLSLGIASFSQGKSPFIDWNNIKNPVYSHPGWSVKDACVAYNDGWFYLFFSAFFHDAGQERCHVVSVRTKDFRTYSEPLFILSGMEDGWIGMASPDLHKIGNEWILTYNSWGDKKDRPNQLFYSTSRDLVKWSGIKPLAKNITEGVRAIDAAIYSFNNKIYLVWKRRQEPLIAVGDSISSNSWKIIGRPVDEWFENGQFMNIDGRIHIFATTSTKHHFPSVSVMNGNGSSDQDWLKWEKFRIMDVPVEEFNTDEAANAASVADWRDKDGWFYILYAGRTESISHLGRGDNKLGLARSKDLVKWEIPGDKKRDNFKSLESNAQESISRLFPDTTRKNQMNISGQPGGEWQIETKGNDPYFFTLPLKDPAGSNSRILSFEYFCPQGLDHMEIFFGPPLSEARSKRTGKVGLSEGWTIFNIDLSEAADWGKPGDWLRVDFGGRSGVNIRIRNIILRPMTEREKLLAETGEKKRQYEAEFEGRLTSYLAGNFPSAITRVAADENNILIEGKTDTKELFLCEVPPYMDVTETSDFAAVIPVRAGKFSIKTGRIVSEGGISYDRILSKWVLASRSGSRFILRSHARYPDEVTAKYPQEKVIPEGRKGLGGFSTSRGHLEDLDELGITSATINIWFTRFMFTSPAPGRIAHNYMGRKWYFGERDVSVLDSTFRTTAKKGIVTAAILLVGKAEQCPDPEIGRLLQHPDMDPAGIYSMPNMTTLESTGCYAAAIDFLASRYSRPDKKYGMLNHWIIHNEVDAGWVWTNMGEKSALLYMDTYIKSMRLCYAIARNYNPHSEVFISLTHHWAWTSHPKFHTSKELMELLLKYTRAEGDFRWAVAHHPYPQSLFEPKTWLDEQVDFTFSTQLITFRNLEVIDAYIKLPELLYKGRHKRTLWLSENGTNSRSYSEKDLAEQAAGFAYAWKKMKNLDGIDGFQWHNWMDHRGEGGLRLGLRKFPDDRDDPAGRKPVWYLYKAADTEREDELFNEYRKLIGIEGWNEIINSQKIR